jgi:hypothetical protein
MFKSRLAAILLFAPLIVRPAYAQDRPAPAGAPTASSPAEAPYEQEIRVVIDSKERPVVFIRVNRFSRADASEGMDVEDLTPECTSPCNLKVDRDGVYRIAGPGVVPSRAFGLPAEGTETTLHVRAASLATRTTGQWVALGGGVVAVAGALMLTRGLIGDAGQPTYTGPYPAGYPSSGATGPIAQPGDYSVLTASGAGLLAVGVATAAFGIYLWLSSSTSVTTGDGRSIAGSAPAPGLPFAARGWVF